ncbi:MAG: hypothetical protein ACE5EG_05385, partial [Thermoanaerobaculia bacterium]
MGRDEAQKRIAALREELRRHEYLYHVRDRPEISDQAYDELFHELKALEEEFPELRSEDSPTQRVGGTALSSLPTVEHEAPMLSLDSSAELEAVRRFDERLRRLLGDDLAYTLEPKLDGASIELVYERGRLTRAATRYSLDVRVLPADGGPVVAHLVLDGEGPAGLDRAIQRMGQIKRLESRSLRGL